MGVPVPVAVGMCVVVCMIMIVAVPVAMVVVMSHGEKQEHVDAKTARSKDEHQPAAAARLVSDSERQCSSPRYRSSVSNPSLCPVPFVVKNIELSLWLAPNFLEVPR